MYKNMNNSNDHEYENKRRGMKRPIIHVLTRWFGIYTITVSLVFSLHLLFVVWYLASLPFKFCVLLFLRRCDFSENKSAKPWWIFRIANKYEASLSFNQI